MTSNILVVDDEPHIADTVREALELEGYRARAVYLGHDAITAAREEQFDLVILDMVLPDVNGLFVCRRIKEISDTPVQIHTAEAARLNEALRSRNATLLAAYGVGATDVVEKPDDLLDKPYQLDVLLAKVKVLVKRGGESRVAPAGTAAAPETDEAIHLGALEVGRSSRWATLELRPLELTPSEHHILLALASHPGRIVPRAQLIRPGSYADGGGRHVDAHVLNLRRKLAAGGASAPTIASVRGEGYRLDPAPR